MSVNKDKVLIEVQGLQKAFGSTSRADCQSLSLCVCFASAKMCSPGEGTNPHASSSLEMPSASLWEGTPAGATSATLSPGCK